MRAQLYSVYLKNPVKILVNTRKEKLLLAEIGFDHITTATSFVDYISEKHGFSKSCIWYNLKKLKKMRVLDFAEKGEPGKPLYLTREGVATLRGLLSSNSVAEQPLSSSAPSMFDVQQHSLYR